MHMPTKHECSYEAAASQAFTHALYIYLTHALYIYLTTQCPTQCVDNQTDHVLHACLEVVCMHALAQYATNATQDSCRGLLTAFLVSMQTGHQQGDPNSYSSHAFW
jgi:hypothetical protein